MERLEMKIALVGAAVALAALIVMAFLLWQSLEKLDAIEGGVVVGLEDVSDEIGEQQQGILDKLDAIEGGVVVGLKDVSDEIGEQRQGIADMVVRLVELEDLAARLVDLEERAATPHESCWWVNDEQRYAAAQWNSRYDNNIYKQQIWGARIDMLALLAAIWNCPFQAAWGFGNN